MTWSFWLTIMALLVWSAPLAFTAVFFVGFAKECWDSRYGSGFCLFDMVGNFVGIFVGLLCGFVFSALF